MRYRGFVDAPSYDVIRAISKDEKIARLEREVQALQREVADEKERSGTLRLRIVQVVLAVSVGVIVAIHSTTTILG